MSSSAEMTPYLTLALCTHNHADRLRRTLADLKQLQHPSRPWEIVIVDNASRDETPELLADPAWRPPGVPVRVVREAALGLSHARNRALREAQGEYLIFIDDDETPDPNWLCAYEQAMVAFNPDALGGRIEVLFEDGDRPAWLQDQLLGFLGKLDHGEARWLTDPRTAIFGGNFAFRREVFEKIGVFDTALGRKGAANIGGEDVEVHRRLLAAGCSVRWVPEAVIHHRIQTPKLRRGYFLELHYRQGRIEGVRARNGSRLPAKHLFGQFLRATFRALKQRWREGANHSLRLEMNMAYFFGYILGWIFDEHYREPRRS